MVQSTPHDTEYNLDTSGLSLAPSADDKETPQRAKRSGVKGLINDNELKGEKRQMVRRTGTDRRYEIRFECEDRRKAGSGRRASERHWQSTD